MWRTQELQTAIWDRLDVHETFNTQWWSYTLCTPWQANLWSQVFCVCHDLWVFPEVHWLLQTL